MPVHQSLLPIIDIYLMARLLFLTLLALASPCAASMWGPPPPYDLETQGEGLLAKVKTLVGDKVGEPGIGFGVGVCAGLVCKKVQNLIIGAAVVSAGVAGGAVAAGYISPEDLKNKAEDLKETAEGVIDEHKGKVFGVVSKLKGSKVALTNFAKKHSGLTAGMAGGAAVGYSLG